jgi:hypothetical protein
LLYILLAAANAGCGDTGQSPSGESPLEGPILREAAAQVGLDFHHFTGSAGEYFLCEIMGGGVGVFDYDGDGDLDVYLLQGKMIDPKKSLQDARFPAPARHWPGNRLFRNELIPAGELRFTDVTEQTGLGHEGYGMGVTIGDFDNDGDLDLYVTNFGPNVLYQNNGDGTFSDVTGETGLDDPRWSTSASFLDYDRDGDLDLFFANYIDFTLANNKECFDPTGARLARGRHRRCFRQWPGSHLRRLQPRRLDRYLCRQRRHRQPAMAEPRRWNLRKCSSDGRCSLQRRWIRRSGHGRYRRRL